MDLAMILFSLQKKKNKAMAELMPEEKSQISHRAHALKKLEELLPSFVTGAENS